MIHTVCLKDILSHLIPELADPSYSLCLIVEPENHFSLHSQWVNCLAVKAGLAGFSLVVLVLCVSHHCHLKSFCHVKGHCTGCQLNHFHFLYLKNNVYLVSYYKLNRLTEFTVN